MSNEQMDVLAAYEKALREIDGLKAELQQAKLDILEGINNFNTIHAILEETKEELEETRMDYRQTREELANCDEELSDLSRNAERLQKEVMEIFKKKA